MIIIMLLLISFKLSNVDRYSFDSTKIINIITRKNSNYKKIVNRRPQNLIKYLEMCYPIIVIYLSPKFYIC